MFNLSRKKTLKTKHKHVLGFLTLLMTEFFFFGVEYITNKTTYFGFIFKIFILVLITVSLLGSQTGENI